MALAPALHFCPGEALMHAPEAAKVSLAGFPRQCLTGQSSEQFETLRT